MKKLLLSLALLAFGCAGTAIQKPSICDTIPAGDSVICDLSERVGQPVETVAGILKLSNVAALAADLYTAQQANKFIDKTIGYLKTTSVDLTYVSAVQYVLTTLSMMTPEAQAVFIILDDFVNVDFGSVRLLSEFDIGLLLKHLNDQKLILVPFLIE